MWSNPFNAQIRRTASGLPPYPQSFYEHMLCYKSHVYPVLDESLNECPPFACLYCTSREFEDVVLIAKENGQITVLDMSETHLTAEKLAWRAHSNAIFDMKWLQDDALFLTACGDHLIGLYDLVSQARVSAFCGHTGTVKSLSVCPTDRNIFSSASRDGSLRLWDIRSCKTQESKGIIGLSSISEVKGCHVPANMAEYSASPVRRLSRRQPKLDGGTRISVTSTAFIDENRIATSGSTDGLIKVWDQRKLRHRGASLPVQIFPYCGHSQKENGFSDLVVTSNACHLFAYCLDNVIYQYDLASPHSERPAYTYSAGHIASSFYIKMSLSMDERVLACGSNNRQAYMYPVLPRSNPRIMPAITLPGHLNEVTVVRFSPNDPLKLTTLSDDCKVRLWQFGAPLQEVTYEPGSLEGIACLTRRGRSLRSPLGEFNHSSSFSGSFNTTQQRSGGNLTRTPSSRHVQHREQRQLTIHQFLSPMLTPREDMATPSVVSALRRSRASVLLPGVDENLPPMIMSLDDPGGPTASVTASSSPSLVRVCSMQRHVLANNTSASTSTQTLRPINNNMENGLPSAMPGYFTPPPAASAFGIKRSRLSFSEVHEPLCSGSPLRPNSRRQLLRRRTTKRNSLVPSGNYSLLDYFKSDTDSNQFPPT